MSIADYIYKNIPKDYPNMYLDGYTPEQIRSAVVRDMLEQHQTVDDGFEVHIKSEVKKK